LGVDSISEWRYITAKVFSFMPKYTTLGADVNLKCI